MFELRELSIYQPRSGKTKTLFVLVYPAYIMDAAYLNNRDQPSLVNAVHFIPVHARTC